MPVETRISAEFGKIVTELMGEDSLGQGTVRTSISTAYLMWMKRGKVPKPDVIRRFAEGYKDRGADLQKLMIAAGYEQPTDALSAIGRALQDVTDIDEAQKEKILRYAEKVKRGDPASQRKAS